jgi:hypothetical protein
MNQTPMSRKLAAPCALAVVLAALSGCATGTTHTQGTLYMDAREAVLAADNSAAPGCSSRRVLNTEVVNEPDVIVTPLPDTRVPNGPIVLPRGFVVDPTERRFSKSVERWTVEHCGKQASYLVTFLPADDGGTEISVKPEG